MDGLHGHESQNNTFNGNSSVTLYCKNTQHTQSSIPNWLTAVLFVRPWERARRRSVFLLLLLAVLAVPGRNVQLELDLVPLGRPEEAAPAVFLLGLVLGLRPHQHLGGGLEQEDDSRSRWRPVRREGVLLDQPCEGQPPLTDRGCPDVLVGGGHHGDEQVHQDDDCHEEEDTVHNHPEHHPVQLRVVIPCSRRVLVVLDLEQVVAVDPAQREGLCGTEGL